MATAWWRQSMIKRLRRRLTILFTAFTGLVLVFVLAFSLWYSLQQNMFNHQLAFTTDAQFVLNGAIADTLTPEWLTAVEKERKLLIEVTIDGVPIDFDSGWAEQDEHTAALGVARELFSADFFQSEVAFASNTTTAVALPSVQIAPDMGEVSDYSVMIAPATLQSPSGEEYWGTAYSLSFASFSVASAPVVSGASLTVQVEEEFYVQTFQDVELIVLKSTDDANRQAVLTVLGYVGLLFVGIAILGVINYFLAKLVIKPTEASVRQQTEFVAAASHELRSPLAVIRSSAEMGVKAKSLPDSKQYFELVNSEAVRMSRLVDDLLVLAGSESGRWHIQQNWVDLDALLIEATDSFSAMGKEKNIQLDLQLPEQQLGKLKGDDDRLMQVLRILIDNAIQYSPTEDTITLKAERHKNRVRIFVADHGPGIAEEEKIHIFDRFYRSDKSRTDKSHFGLGLSVAKELVQMHGGTISVSDTEGGGATFEIVFPMREQQDKP